MKPITYSQLLQRLSEKSRAAVDRLLGDSGVHYLIVLQANSDARPKILPAGPNLDFRHPKDAAGQVIRGMRAVAYVDLKAEAGNGAEAKSKPTDASNNADKEKIRELEAKVVWFENENNNLEQRLRRAKRLFKEKEIKIAELSKRNEMLHARMDEYNCSGDPDTEKRLKDIENTENELIKQMNELLRKEAEIEQREENLIDMEKRQIQA